MKSIFDMVRRKIIYFFVLAAWSWLVMLYTFQEIRFLLLILLCIPLLVFVPLVFQRHKTEVKISEIPDYVTREENIRLRVTVTNKSLLPLAGLKVRGTWQVHGAKRLSVESRIRGLSGRTEREIEFKLPAGHCGQAEFTVARIRIYDCLSLFSIPVSGRLSRKIWITPRFLPVLEGEAAMIFRLARAASASDEGESFVREYRPGDSLRSIHWKLTVKTDELHVRDFEPEGQVSLFLNMTDGLLERPEQKDLFLDKACSLMVFLAETCGDRAVVCWMQDGVLMRSRIREAEDIYPCIREVISTKKTGVRDPGEKTVRCMLAGCHLEEDGKLYLGEQCADEE